MSNDENLIEPDIHEAEESIDRMLRPKYLSEYVGQQPVKQQMEIFIEAAKNRQESLDHVLIMNSLSKRSSVPGLRSGFVAGDPNILGRFKHVRD